MTQLVRYEAACRAVAEAKSVDEVKHLRDQSEVMRAYARQAKNRQLEIDAAEIRLRAERRLGELLQAAKSAGQIKAGRPENPSREEGLKNPSNEAGFSRVTLQDAGIDYKLSSRAQKLADVPEREFEGMIADWRERVAQENERVTTNLLRAGERARRDAELEPPEFPDGKYGVIYADPPWQYEHSKTTNREIENHYPTMTLEAICELPVSDLAADDCILFLWATSPKLAEAMKVIESWGFTYRTQAVWVKPQIGMGYYFRQRHELLLVATKGEPGVPAPENRPPSVIEHPRGKHSAKPPQVYEIIEAMYPAAPKIELFARNQRDGWEQWGNQAAA